MFAIISGMNSTHEAERVAARMFWVTVSVIGAVALIDIVLLLAVSRSLQRDLIAIQSKTDLPRRGNLTEHLANKKPGRTKPDRFRDR